MILGTFFFLGLTTMHDRPKRSTEGQCPLNPVAFLLSFLLCVDKCT